MFQKLFRTLIYVDYSCSVYLKNNTALLKSTDLDKYAYLSVYSECSIRQYQPTETIGVHMLVPRVHNCWY